MNTATYEALEQTDMSWFCLKCDTFILTQGKEEGKI